jgi:Tfp pilus assembly protein PilF
MAVTDQRANVARIETRGNVADLAQLKAQAPLPETADELCAVAQDLRVDAALDIRLGSQATEREVKRLSASGELARYRMLHFATHGTLAGELKGTPEPGLILTPPETATENDDGFLSTSEIAALKLDADWVVLSACNTAAGGATSAEALSGLAGAFIYAGARSLLVSHWAVYSEATVKLITGAVGEMTRDPKVGRAEAMRRSMVALIDKGTREEAHPAFWAPFVVVGEGAAPHLNKRDGDTAIADATKSIENASAAYANRAVAYMNKGESDRAIADATKAIEIAPTLAFAYAIRAAAYGNKGESDRAIADATKSIEINPRESNAYWVRGNAHSAKRNYDRAIADYSRAIEINPKNASYLNSRAWAYFKAENAKQGLPDAERSLQLRPDDAATLDTRGHIFEALGRRDEAVADFRRALSIDSNQRESRDALKRLGAGP